MHRIFIISILLLLSIIAHSNNNKEKQKTINVYCFAKLYGYVKYFRPYECNRKIDWSKFAIYGVRQVESANNNPELNSILLKIFKPIAPEIIITDDSILAYQIKKTPENSKYSILATLWLWH
jgi:hypothetical protein